MILNTQILDVMKQPLHALYNEAADTISVYYTANDGLLDTFTRDEYADILDEGIRAGDALIINW